MQQRKRNASEGRRAHLPVRRDFTAAVRYRDGSSELFRIRNADDADDARAMVLAEVDDVVAVVVVVPHS